MKSANKFAHIFLTLCLITAPASAEVPSGVPSPISGTDAPPMLQPETPAAAEENAHMEWTFEGENTRQDVNIVAGNSRVMRFNRPIARISISDPDIADVLILSSNEVLVNTKQKGTANLIVWDAKESVYTYDLIVTSNPNPIKDAIRSIDPTSNVDVFPTEKGFVIKGNVATVESQTQIANTVKAFSEDSVSLVTVKDVQQILLEIRFIEVDRSNGFSFGIDGEYIAEKVGFTFLGGSTGATLAAETVANVANSDFSFPTLDKSNASPIFTGGFTDDSNKVQTFLKALESKNHLKVIARPNLLVRDGEAANFLVGGEFPVPTVTQNTVNVEYKEFGTKLTYKPEILSDGKIRLKVTSEVSQLDFANGVTVNNFLIPALSSRKTETVVELKNDFSLVIGGLIQQKRSKSNSGTPVLRRIPLLGKLFSSTEDTHTDVELMVVVTPRLIDPNKESFKLSQIGIDDPRHSALEMEPPLFEENRALAIEQTLTMYENETRNTKEVAEDRTLERNRLYKEFVEEKKRKRDLEFAQLVDELLTENNGPAPQAAVPEESNAEQEDETLTEDSEESTDELLEGLEDTEISTETDDDEALPPDSE